MLNAASIIAEAEAKVGIGDSETGVRTNLEQLIAALDATFPMSAEGRTKVRAMLVRDAVNRLESLKWVQDYPEIAQEPIAPTPPCRARTGRR